MKLLSIFALFISFSLSAQVTKTIIIEGAIAKPVVVNFADLKTYKSTSIDSLQIFNHKGEYKSIKLHNKKTVELCMKRILKEKLDIKVKHLIKL
jgi:hypothetical protein